MEHPPKYPSTPYWPKSPTVDPDDLIVDDPARFVGNTVVVTEKLDGGNTSIWNGEVYARSTGQPSHAGWMAMVRKHHAWKTLGHTETVIYGEDLFGIHSIEYDPIPERHTFRPFAVRKIDAEEDTFLEWDQVVDHALMIEVPTVPVLFLGRFQNVKEIDEWFAHHLNEPSNLGLDREGFVIRSADSFPANKFKANVAKYVRPNHVQTDEHWTKNWKHCRLA